MLRRTPDASGVFSMVRPGRVLFGLPPSPALEGAWPLRPALSWETAISYLKRVPAGARLSLSGAWTAARATRVASLPVGYGDGYPARLGNRSEVLVRGQRAPVIGRVGIDLTLVDVTDVPGVQEGDRVTLLGCQDGQEVSAAELAALLDLPPDAILTGISRSQVPRIHYEGRAPILAAEAPAGG
jgi:alanine racemase